MSNKNLFDYYRLWEEINNENFNSVESHKIKIAEVGYNRFTMTPNLWKRDISKSISKYKFILYQYMMKI